MPVAALAPLRHRSYALAWTASFVSSIGSWMQSVALGIYLFETTHQPLWLGLVTMAAWLPSALGAPVGGVVADRWNRQRWIQSNNVVMAGCASTLAVLVLTGRLSPTLVVALAVLEGLSSSASWAAWQSLLPDLVERDEVLAAVSLSSAQFNLGRVLGPALAGVVLLVGSIGWCFAVNAASFVFVVVSFAFVRCADRPAKATAFRPLAELAEGARAAVANAACRHAIAWVAAIAFVLSPFISLVPAMAIGVLHAGHAGTTWLVSAQGLGAVAGSLSLPSLARRTSRLVVLRGSMLVLVLAILAYGLAPSLEVAMGALFLTGGAYVGTLNGLNASVQLHAPRAERSRILSLYTLSLSLAFPFGSLLQSALAGHYGVRTVTVASAVLGATGLLAVLGLRPRLLRAMAAAPSGA
jgi:MFS family permease